jgi:hypothetical protein
MQYSETLAQSLAKVMDLLETTVEALASSTSLVTQEHTDFKETQVPETTNKDELIRYANANEALAMQGATLRTALEGARITYDCWKHTVRWAVRNGMIVDPKTLADLEHHLADPLAKFLAEMERQMQDEEDLGISEDIVTEGLGDEVPPADNTGIVVAPSDNN